jgi:aspartyl-tRNA synthetase
LTKFAIDEGANGLGYITFGDEGEVKGPIAKFLNQKPAAKFKKLLRN